MKFIGMELNRNRIIGALFGWSMILPSKVESDKPFVAKTSSSETEDESWIEPLVIAEDSILRRTDPLLMTKQERRENTIRYIMERQGYSRKDVEKPLTDERLSEIGRCSKASYRALEDRVRKKSIELGGILALDVLLDKPSDLDLGIIEKPQ